MAGRFALQHITKRFGALAALDGVDFVLEPGEVHALLGENGAGKTTLLRIAYGLETADQGALLVQDQPVDIASPRDAQALGLGMVHQHFTSVPRLSVGENIALSAGWPIDRKAIRRRVEHLCHTLELPLDPDALVESLPVALKQRLEIIKALATETSVLLLDEPTAVLTPPEVDSLMTFVRHFAEQGGAVALVTHKLSEVLAGADRVTVLRRGRVTYDGWAKDETAEGLTRHMIGQDLLPDRRPTSHASTHIAVRASAVALPPIRTGTGLFDGTLDVRAGEIVGIAAVEGNGQRELLRIIAGVWNRAGGDLHVAQPCAFVPEDRTIEGLIPEMTVTENVVLGVGDAGEWISRPFGVVDWKRAQQATAALIEAHDIDAPSTVSPVKELSGGNQQKLIIGRALMESPATIVAENPTRGLDVKATADTHQRLREAALGGAAVLFYSSDLDEVLEVADRVIVVANGRTREAGTRERSRVGAMMLEGRVARPPGTR